MDPSALIFVALAVAWAVYLLPKALKHHDSVQRGRSVRRRCFASDGHRIVMPAFGSYTGSLNVLDRAYAALFRWERFFAYMLGRDRVFAIARPMLQNTWPRLAK